MSEIALAAMVSADRILSLTNVEFVAVTQLLVAQIEVLCSQQRCAYVTKASVAMHARLSWIYAVNATGTAQAVVRTMASTPARAACASLDIVEVTAAKPLMAVEYVVEMGCLAAMNME
mmetsp:Transcript_15267/g.38547  ORF Transcript_15267/g.38547 Transcript_15267/m.38547 type:complete len:118 (-) Transcript_15267:1173-1526(-)